MPMENDDDILKVWGLSHAFGKDWNTYFSLVTLDTGKTQEMFFNHIKNAFKAVEKHVTNKNLRINIVGITFGHADAVIVWQAKNSEAAKAFRDAVLAGNGHHSITMCCIASDGHGHS